MLLPGPTLWQALAAIYADVLAGMACDPHIKVPWPPKYTAATVQHRRKQRRPSAKGSEVGDVGEARALDRIALQKDYVLQQIRTAELALQWTSLTHFKFVTGEISS